ncbi:hypothetical protein [Acetobacter cerevisiae]|uniref:Uncharacterized protein n=1 Tax=Acetobacter cerevisiae TaxID=178900 RepID=A0A149Q2S8_9PROT|nr:hypothetical protein [Acetobacter cerevisiae]KXU91648.1 hypothetical protein AD928_12990 [Acetobacter cerevisiae]GBQ06360.1 hypothetical protein AA14362_0829 [Acetobacter cerevisiae DSM 14362]
MKKASFLLFCTVSIAGTTGAFTKAFCADTPNVVTDVFSDPVKVKHAAHDNAVEIPASALLNHPVLGVDPTDGWLQVQTDQGVVLVKPSKVGTSGKVATPKTTNCALLSPSSRAANNETPGLASGCR